MRPFFFSLARRQPRISLIRDLHRAFKRGGRLCPTVAARADPVREEEKRTFVRKPRHALQLLRGEALLAGRVKPERQRPMEKRDVAPLHHRPNLDRVLLAAPAAPRAPARTCGPVGPLPRILYTSVSPQRGHAGQSPKRTRLKRNRLGFVRARGACGVNQRVDVLGYLRHRGVRVGVCVALTPRKIAGGCRYVNSIVDVAGAGGLLPRLRAGESTEGRPGPLRTKAERAHDTARQARPRERLGPGLGLLRKGWKGPGGRLGTIAAPPGDRLGNCFFVVHLSDRSCK